MELKKSPMGNPIPRHVLVVYKKSAYQTYVMQHKNAVFRNSAVLSHSLQQATLAHVLKVLRKYGIPYKSIFRASRVDYKPFDFVISVGGDGTFLKAARRIKTQTILGINSDPGESIGSFCGATAETFEHVFKRILKGTLRAKRLNRIQVKINGRLLKATILNDVLFCHRNPAAMSRYWLQVGRRREDHRSSGLWVSTAAGSTGAIRSAGGSVLALESDKLQYCPRELYRGRGTRYRLEGGCLARNTELKIGSLMREGVLYLDGPPIKIPFGFVDVIEILRSPYPLRAILPRPNRRF